MTEQNSSKQSAAVLYSCVIDNAVCSVIQEDKDKFFCQVADMQYTLEHGFTEDEKTLDFLMECIVSACYRKYLAYKELEDISFD